MCVFAIRKSLKEDKIRPGIGKADLFQQNKSNSNLFVSGAILLLTSFCYWRQNALCAREKGALFQENNDLIKNHEPRLVPKETNN